MSVLEGNGRRELEESVLQSYVSRQRWFGGKSRPITGIRIEDWAVFNQGVSALVLIEVQYAEGACDTYLITLGLLFGRGAAALREESPNAVIARVTSVAGDGVLHEAIFNDSASEALLAIIVGRCPDFLARGHRCGSSQQRAVSTKRRIRRHGTAARFRGAKQHLDHLRRKADHEVIPQTANRPKP